MEIITDKVAEVTLSYSTTIPIENRFKIESSEDAYKILEAIWSKIGDIEYRERFCVLLVNRANQLLGYHWISAGGSSGTVADPKIIFQAGLLGHASGLILGHNHPSGNLKPSEADKSLTEKIKSAGKLLDICILDHLILTSDYYLSMADEGYM